MSDSNLHLDGNAAAGVLSELFAHDMTAALGTCASCGTSSPLATTMAYMHAPGTVLRCPACSAVVMRLVHARDRLLVDVAGIRRLEVPSAEGT